MRKLPLALLPLLVFALVSANAARSLVTLDTGEQLIGEILPQSSPVALMVRSPLLGEIKVPRARVVSIQAKAPQPQPVKSSPVAQAMPKKVGESVINEEAIIEERAIIDTVRDFKAPDDWSGNMRLGINLSQGDRKWVENHARGKLEIDPKQSPSFYRLTGSYTYRQTERSNGEEFKSTDKYDAEFTYRRTFFESWFTQNAFGYRADQIKGIDREAQASAGIGYQYKPSNRFKLISGGGGGFEEFKADFEDTRAGLSPIANIFQEATWQPFKRTSIIQKFNYYWNPENSGQFNYLLTAAIRMRLTDLLGFEFSYNKSFDNDVGNRNVRDDVQWRNALVFYF
jgi:putative salt-induced outer membrane protein YdiY